VFLTVITWCAFLPSCYTALNLHWKIHNSFNFSTIHLIQSIISLFNLFYFLSTKKNVGLKNPFSTSGTLDRCWQIIQSSVQRRNINFLQLVITAWWAREFRLFGEAPDRGIVRIYGKPRRQFSGDDSILDFSAITRTWKTPLAYTFLCSGMQVVNIIYPLHGRGVTLTPHPLLVPMSKNRVELYLYSTYGPLWPVKRVKPTYCLQIRK
jgi:hypothetical protein